MSRPSIKTTLISILFTLGAIMACFAAFSVHSLTQVNSNVEKVSQDWLPSIQAAKELDTALSDLRVAYLEHLAATDAAHFASAVSGIKRERARIEGELNKYEAMVDFPRETELIKQFRGKLSTLDATGEKFVAFSSMNTVDGNQSAKALSASEMDPIADSMANMIDEMVAINNDGAKTSYAASNTTFSSTMTFAYGVIMAMAFVVLGAVYFAVIGVARPVQLITRSMSHLAEGDTTQPIPFAGRSDEIGAMATAVEVFRQAAIVKIRLESAAEANRLNAEADRVRVTADAEAAAQKRLREATSSLADGLKRLAEGDLSFEIVEPFAPDFESLRHDLNGAVTQLAETMRSVAQSTSSIDVGTREISQSAEDLSKRTEQQAASLEETAAALDQITANVVSSSKRADEARSVAVQANTSAAQSGRVVADAVDAMQRIEQSSNQISNIIGVIDEIAFQTNLLALNAGVEAARAGEAGRGFAVVAQEVRELAQRSAKAAKEIKDLISNSTSEVENGVRLVRGTGEALGTIESFIVTINQHMDAIATSAREQSTGLAEVNTAVNQMDQVTQQNAAMVEETNAAGASLASETSRLRELISKFQLVGSNSSNIQSLRRTASEMSSRLRPVSTSAGHSHGSLAVKPTEWEDF